MGTGAGEVGCLGRVACTQGPHDGRILLGLLVPRTSGGSGVASVGWLACKVHRTGNIYGLFNPRTFGESGVPQSGGLHARSTGRAIFTDLLALAFLLK